jgi:DNA-binding transcriptional regulator GbsR (MarR family)
LAINAIFEKLNTIFINKNINRKIKKKYEAYKHVKHQSPNRKEKSEP